MSESAAGTGLARRASERLLRHGLDDLGLARIIAIVDDPNERSHVLIKRLGFRWIGVDTGPAYTQAVYEVVPDQIQQGPFGHVDFE